MAHPAPASVCAVGSRELARAEREGRVWAAARELFVTHGFRDTSIKAIAERANVSVGTVARTAGTKTELFERMFYEPDTSAMLGRFAHFATQPGADFADEMDRTFGVWLLNADGQPEFVRDFLVTLVEGPKNTDARRDADQRMIAAIASRLRYWHPHLDAEQAHSLAFGAFSVYVTALIGVLARTLELDEARRHVQTNLVLLGRCCH